MRRGTRFVSDELKFTGTDLGDRSGALRRRAGQGDTASEDGDSSDSDGPDIDEMDLALMTPMEKEEFLVQSAMARIQRARERGLSDVNLSKLELDALERRRAREEEKAEKMARKKRKEQRIAIPLTQLEPSSRKKRSGSKSQLSSRHQSATDLSDAPERRALPPVGYFPPPAGSRPRSGTTDSRRPPTRGYDERGSSPFQYEQRPASRHASDTVSRSHSSRYHQDDGAASSSSGSRTALDPFQFQTEDPHALRSSGAAASSKRHTMPSESPYRTRSGRTRGAVRRTPSSDETSSEGNVASDESTDDYGSGARVKQVPSGRQSAIVVEESPEPAPEPEPEPVKKKSSSPAKRKPVASRVRRSKKK